jgi:glycosyltransferase involved in cell wall biosynthesis
VRPTERFRRATDARRDQDVDELRRRPRAQASATPLHDPVVTRGGRLRVHTLIDSLTWGGAEMLLADLAIGAPSAGIDLSVGYLKEADNSPSARRLEAAGVKPSFVGPGRLLDLASLRRVRADLRARSPDIVHTHLPTADLLGVLCARSLGIPSVSTIHLIGRSVTDQLGPRLVLKEKLTTTVRGHGAARTVAVSDAARRAYLERHRSDPERLVTIHSGIAQPQPKAERGALRAELGISHDDLVVAMVSVLREGKGHELALEAIARLRPRHPRLVLLIAGEGPARQHVERLAEPLGTRAVLAGHRDSADVLAAADILLHPTLMDAFPTVLLEAGAASLPILATAVGGIPEIVSDGDTGLLITNPPSVAAVATGLERLLADPALRARLGANARASYERKFTAERWAQRLRGLYDQVLVEGRRRPVRA